MSIDNQTPDSPREQISEDLPAGSPDTLGAAQPTRSSRSRGRGGRRRSPGGRAPQSTEEGAESAPTVAEAPEETSVAVAGVDAAELTPTRSSRSRRGGRRRTAARAAQNGATDLPLDAAEAPEVSAEAPVSDEDSLAPRDLDEPEVDAAEEPEAPAASTPAKGRGRAKAVASPVVVDVHVPRGFARRVDSKLVRKVVESALERNGWALPSSLDVVFVTDADMKEINATRRGIDEATDVLSFPVLELLPGQGVTQDFFVLPPETVPHLGDVVISVDRFETQADEGGHSRQRELAFLTVHGVLHILGFDHESEEERRQMRRREEDVLSELGLRRDGS